MTRCPECGAELERVVTESGGQTFEQVVSSLLRDHTEFREQLRSVRAALAKPDLKTAVASLREFGTSLDRHVVDEEARVLKVLIEVHGRDGAGEAIRTMQQHRRVVKLADELAHSLPLHPEQAPAKLAELEKLAEEQFRAEERRILPWAVETSKKSMRGS